MKDLFELLNQTLPSRDQSTWWIGEDAANTSGILKPWVLLNRTEMAVHPMRKALENLSTFGWTGQITSCEIQFYDPAHLGDHLELEARLHRVERRKVVFKLSIWKVLPSGKTRRIGKASYVAEGKQEKKAA